MHKLVKEVVGRCKEYMEKLTTKSGMRTSAALTALLVIRTYLTVIPVLNINLLNNSYFYIKLIDVINLAIWLLVAMLSTQSAKFFKTLDELNSKKAWKIFKNFLGADLHLFPKIMIVTGAFIYEVWMIYFTYATFSSYYAFTVQTLKIISAVTFLLHFIYQTLFLLDISFPKKLAHNKDGDLLIFFNIVMLVHLISTAYLALPFSSYSTGQLLGVSELVYRIWAIRVFLTEYVKKHEEEMGIQMAVGSMPGMETLAEVVVRFSKDSKSLWKWAEHGLMLQLPPGTVATFRIRIVQPHFFQLPDGFDLFSPVYWITVENGKGCVTDKGATLFIQHCVDIEKREQCNQLKFAVCQSHETNSPYVFEPCGGLFNYTRHCDYGKLDLTTLCGFCVVGPEQIKNERHVKLVAKTFFERAKPLPLATKYKVHFMIVPKLDAMASVLNRRYQYMQQGSSCSMKVIDSSIQIALEEFPSQIIPINNSLNAYNGWRLTPQQKFKIMRSDICVNSEPEVRELCVEWTKPKKPIFQPMKIVFQGTENSEFLHIDLTDYNSRLPKPRKARVGIIKLVAVVAACIVAFFLGMLFALFLFDFLSSYNSGPVVRPHPSPFIESTDELYQELPEFIPLSKFCMCLGIAYAKCQKVGKDKEADLLNLAAMWYRGHPYHPVWSNVVEALMCCGYCQEARKLADRRGMDFERIFHHSKNKDHCNTPT